MEPDELENRLTAWWLQLAPSRQEELLVVEPPPMPWLDASLDQAGLARGDVQAFLAGKRRELEPTRDAGGNPRPEGSS